MHRLLSLLPLLTLLSLVTFIHGPMLTKPFYGHHDWVSVLYGQIARNNLRYGLVTTRFGQVTNAGIVTPSKFDYHTHHPLLWPLLITASVAVFGLHEWAIRLVPFLSTLTAVGVYFVLIRRAFGSFISFFSSLFIIATPMFLYFAVLPDKEPFVLFLLLLIVYYYLSLRVWHLSSFAPIFILFIVGGLTHWLFYLLPTVFFFDLFLFRKKDRKKIFSLLFIVGCLLLATIVFHLWHTHLLTGDWLGGGLRETLGFRLSSSGGDRTNFTTLQYLSKLIVRLGNYFGRIVLPFVIIGLIASIMQRKSSIVLLLLSIGLLYPIVFRNYVYIHDYLLYYMLPFWGLAATLGVINTVRFLQIRLSLPFPLSLFTLLFLLTLLILNLIDRSAMITALRASDWYKRGQEVGETINQHTTPTQKVAIIASSDLAETYARFIEYYGDRSVTYFDQSPKEVSFAQFDLAISLSPDVQIPPPFHKIKPEDLTRPKRSRGIKETTLEMYKKD